MFPKQKIIPEVDFVVADFKSKYMSAELKEWRKNSSVGVVMSCARQIWYGVDEDFEGFPSAVGLLKGKDAYAFMLRLLTGMDSPKKGEVNIKGQFYAGWEEHQKKISADVIKTLDPVMQHLKADSRVIENEILVQHKTHEPSFVARDLAGSTKNKTIILVGNLTRMNNVAHFTDRVIRLITSKNQRADKILITHPDTETSQSLFRQVQKKLESFKINPSILKSVNFNDAFSSTLEQSNIVFVDTVMGENEDADLVIIEAWKGRERKDNVLVHLRGDTTNRGLSNASWSNAELDNYTSPEDIKMGMAERAVTNKEVSQTAEGAYRYCAELRVVGQSASRHKVNQKFLQNTI